MSQRKNASLHGSPSPAPEQRSSNSKRNDEYRDVEYVKRDSYGRAIVEESEDSNEWLVVLGILIVGAILRFHRLGHPDSVVFDEVHFGKFASYYLRREFFFDVHPPLAKLLLAFAGWAIGYDGHFDFDNIGDSYVENQVPYISLRFLPALLGSFIPPVVYGIMRESGYPRIVGILSASLVLFDNAHITQTRLILLDAPLILFMALSFYCYIKFHKYRYSEFTAAWWSWLLLTGIFLSLTISCKMVGLFAFMTVGTAVIIDLWYLLDIKRGLTVEHVAKHFFARVLGLLVIPAVVYLFWFWVHFAILTKSGTGDDFMTSAFQLTLMDSPLNIDSQEIKYYDTIVIKHKSTKNYLHSHTDKYPLKYEDGRISSAGQQVTGYPFNDTNNHWVVEGTFSQDPSTLKGKVVKHEDVITLRHLRTNTTLLTHDVACPTMATNTEFTTWDGKDMAKEGDTHFKIMIDTASAGQEWRSKSSHFQLLHVNTKVVMWTHVDPPLPEWAFKQQEVNGNKNPKDKSTFWLVEDVIRAPGEAIPVAPVIERKVVKSMNFFRKFFELQLNMLSHNAGLTDSHPYASGPINWPFLLSGISFWTGKSENKEQVYLIGNPISWWLCVMALSIFIGILGADQLAKRRGLSPILEATRNRLYNSGGFFMLAWIYHYIPFFSMSRQLFLHHYLPAHLCSALVAGAVFHFIMADTINYPVSNASAITRRRPATKAIVSSKMVVIVAIIIFFQAFSFAFFAPLTYGTPGLEPDEVNRRRWLSSWTLHYAK